MILTGERENNHEIFGRREKVHFRSKRVPRPLLEHYTITYVNDTKGGFTSLEFAFAHTVFLLIRLVALDYSSGYAPTAPVSRRRGRRDNFLNRFSVLSSAREIPRVRRQAADGGGIIVIILAYNRRAITKITP